VYLKIKAVIGSKQPYSVVVTTEQIFKILTQNESLLTSISMSEKILIINGPNLNFLGRPEMSIYGKESLADLHSIIYQWITDQEWQARFFGSNSEGEIIDYIQNNFEWADGMVINPAALSHTSIAIYDCIKSINLPSIEVHLSNIYHREEFLRTSITGLACEKVIVGLGVQGYIEALENLKKIFK